MAENSRGGRRNRIIVAVVLLFVLVAGIAGAVVGTGSSGDTAASRSPSATTTPRSTASVERSDQDDRETGPDEVVRPEEGDEDDEDDEGDRQERPVREDPPSRFAEREAARGDRETELGDAIRVAGRRVRVVTAAHEGGRLVLAVVIDGRTVQPQSYGPGDWSLELVGGGIVEPAPNDRTDALGSGQVTGRDRVEGTVVFDVGPGTYFALFQPEGAERRGVWKVTA